MTVNALDFDDFLVILLFFVVRCFVRGHSWLRLELISIDCSPQRLLVHLVILFPQHFLTPIIIQKKKKKLIFFFGSYLRAAVDEFVAPSTIERHLAHGILHVIQQFKEHCWTEREGGCDPALSLTVNVGAAN